MKREHPRTRGFSRFVEILFLFLLLFIVSAPFVKDLAFKTGLALAEDAEQAVSKESSSLENGQNVNTANKGKKDSITVSVQDDKTKINFPLAREIKVAPEYENSVLKLHFSKPVQSRPVIGVQGHSYIEDMAFYPEKDAAKALKIKLSKRVQFLVSRTSPDQVQVILVSGPKDAYKDNNLKEQGTEETKLTDVEFTQDREGWIHLKLQASQNDFSYQTMPGNQDQVVVSFPGLNIPASHQKLYNLQKFESKAKSALLQATEKGGRLTLKVQERFPVHIDKQDSTFILSFKRQANTEQGLYTSSKTAESLENGGSEVAVRANPEQVEDTEPEQELQELNTLFPGMKEDYTGKPISIDVQDADVEHILRLIAEISDFNLIIDQNVGGRISLKLEEVPWDQALDLVLLQKDLGMVKKGNILRIATREKLENEREQRREARKAALEAKKSLEELEPLKTEYIQINYTKASQIESQVSNFLSDRGQISNDPRTNLLIVSDIQDRIDKIRRVIRKLDRPERQVLIEARVVYATDSFSKSLGISWGFAGAEQYKILGTEMSSTLDGFVLNPPAGPETLGFTATGSHIATQAIDFFNLDAQLKLGETQNVARTVSSPRIVTLNNQAANISQGVKIATSGESESGGTTTEYVDATLNLSVTPQITPDDKLILDLNISDDSPASGGDIDTRTAATRLIVDDKETIVLGGVHQVTENDIENSVPGLKDIPLFSWLFKNQSITNTKRELLIFIRTKILE